jgi:Tol biopolymer transport system component
VSGELSLVVLDRGGRVVREVAANRPWAPRFSPDGRRIAYGAFGEGRSTSDIWITDLDGGSTRRLTDDNADSNDPQWSPDGGRIAYSVSAQGGKDIVEQWATGGGVRSVASWPGTQFPTDWLRDGSALLVSDDAGDNHFNILVQPTDGSVARPYAATRAQETAGRISPHTHWVAYTSNESGRDEVYVDSYPRPGYRAMVSQGGGVDPVWRADGRELYYWRADALMAVGIDGSRGGRPPILGAERVLFHSAYEHSLNSMYDVSPNGERIAIVRRR